MPKNCPFPILDGSVEFTYLCKYMHIYCPFLIQEPRTMDHGVLWRGKVCVHVFQSGAGSSTGPPAWCCLQRYTKLYGICTGYRQDLIGHWTRILGCYILYILLVKETRVIVYFKIPLVDHRDCLGLRWNGVSDDDDYFLDLLSKDFHKPGIQGGAEKDCNILQQQEDLNRKSSRRLT